MKPIPSPVACAALFGTLVAAPAPAQTPTEAGLGDALARVEALEQDYERTLHAFVREMQGVKDQAARDARWRERPTRGSIWLPRFREIARTHPRTEAAFRALNWIRSHASSSDEHGRVVEQLLRDHIDHEDLGQICRRFIGQPHPTEKPENIAIIRRVLAESPHARARAEAGYCLAKVLQHLDADKHDKEIVALLERAVRDAGDVAGVFPNRDLPLARVAELDLFEMRHLQIGCTAPDISGADMQGVAFRLSDYRGKVLFLDFWGHW